MNKKVDFGYKKILYVDKEVNVKNVFDNVADKYDLMNDIMSFYMHKMWKKESVFHCGVKNGDYILDLAGGTGDLSFIFYKYLLGNCNIFIGDININMLRVCRNKFISLGIIDNIFYVHLNAESLPFSLNFFDCVSISFGLRNITNKKLALENIYNVLKPGGRLMILEFSHPRNFFLNILYNFYSFNFIPKIGDYICNDKYSYEYLVESIRLHPDQESLLMMLKDVGFVNCRYKNLSCGIVCIHIGFKF